MLPAPYLAGSSWRILSASLPSFLSFPTSHNSWLTVFSLILLFHLFRALSSPPSSIPLLPFLSLVPHASTFTWRRWQWQCMLTVCVFPSTLNAMGNSSGLFPKVKISALKRKATQQLTAASQCSERSDPPWEGCSFDFHLLLSTEAQERLCLFSDVDGCLLIESRVNYDTSRRFISADWLRNQVLGATSSVDQM